MMELLKISSEIKIYFLRHVPVLFEKLYDSVRSMRGESLLKVGNQTQKICICTILAFLFCGIPPIDAKTFKVVSYNLENLFDLTRDGTEYPEYIPNTDYGWTKHIANIKYTHLARVIKDLAGDVVALQEVESKKALINLRNRLKDFGLNYPYFEIADK